MNLIDRALKSKFADWNDEQLANAFPAGQGFITARLAKVEIQRRDMAREIFPSNTWQIMNEINDEQELMFSVVTY